MGLERDLTRGVESVSTKAEEHDKGGGGGLARTLERIFRDPDQAEALHTLLGPFCHNCRNLLNSLHMALHLASRDPGPAPATWAELEGKYTEVETRFIRLHRICRPWNLRLARLSLSLLMEDRRPSWAGWFAARQRILELASPGRSDRGD